MGVSDKQTARSLFSISNEDFHYWVEKRRKGYYLFNVEEGQVEGPADSVFDALGSGQVGGDYVDIECTIAEEELKAILESSTILFGDDDHVWINEVECASSSVTDILAAYRKSQEGGRRKSA